MKRPFLKIGILGVSAILISLILTMIYYTKTSDNKTSVNLKYKIETAKNTNEIYKVISKKESPERKQIIDKLKILLKFEYLYIALFSLFIFLFSVKCSEIKKEKVFDYIVFLTFLILISSIMENIYFQSTISQFNSGNFEKNFSALKIFKWMKLFSIAIVFSLLSYFYFLKGHIFSKITGTIGLISLILALISFIAPLENIYELFIWSIYIMTMSIALYCITNKKMYFF